MELYRQYSKENFLPWFHERENAGTMSKLDMELAINVQLMS